MSAPILTITLVSISVSNLAILAPMAREYGLEIAEISATLKSIEQVLDLPKLEKEAVELEEAAGVPNLWDDPEAAQAVTSKLSRTQAVISKLKGLRSRVDDLPILFELAAEESDSSALTDAEAELDSTKKAISELEVTTLLSGEYDNRDALITIRSEAGGVEAADWAQMLYRMYLRYCERHEFKVDVLETSYAEEAGIKSATFRVSAPYAYGTLSVEQGTHRLVRISPFDSQSRRHTSFAGVEVVPVVPQGTLELAESEGLPADIASQIQELNKREERFKELDSEKVWKEVRDMVSANEGVIFDNDKPLSIAEQAAFMIAVLEKLGIEANDFIEEVLKVEDESGINVAKACEAMNEKQWNILQRLFIKEVLFPANGSHAANNACYGGFKVAESYFSKNVIQIVSAQKEKAEKRQKNLKNKIDDLKESIDDEVNGGSLSAVNTSSVSGVNLASSTRLPSRVTLTGWTEAKPNSAVSEMAGV
mgnify:CR=1 FL=1